ncbi:hypothetical protein V8E36_007941 [Tilletia maclaganii]
MEKGKARQLDTDALEVSDGSIKQEHPTTGPPKTTTTEAKRTSKSCDLPFELLIEIIRILQAQHISGDAGARRALIAFSQTNKALREWSLDALSRILVLPRHVREFRKFYSRQRASYQPFPCAGYTRALFCGLDDVSRLTAMTAGWESELMRLLHYVGPHLDYLSLWHAESRVILRDPIQVKGQRTVGALQPALQFDEPSLDDVDFPIHADHSVRAEAANRGPSDEDDDDPLPNVSDLPGWLQAEYERLPLREFYRRHKAHVAFRIKSSNILMVQQRKRGCRPRFLSMVISFPFYENEAEAAFPRMTIWSRVEELDFHVPVTKDVGRVLKLTSLLHRSPLRRIRISSQHASIALALPPFHSTRSNRSPLDPLAHSSSWTSDPTDANSPHNLAQGLGRICSSCVLFDLVIAEFQGHHAQSSNLERLQNALEAAVLGESDLGRRSASVAKKDTPSSDLYSLLPPVRAGSLASTLGASLNITTPTRSAVSQGDIFGDDSDEELPPWARFPSFLHSASAAEVDNGYSFSAQNTISSRRTLSDQVERVRVRIRQRGQDVHGKLRFRLQDFRERAEFKSPGSWASMGVWDP